MQEFTVNSLEEYSPLIQAILDHSDNKLIILNGELGSGKTSFTKQFVQFLGSKDTASSPTFSLVNSYSIGPNTVYHFDLYRIKTIDELLDLGFEEYLDNGYYIIIEWPELAIPLLQEKYLSLEFHILNSTSRKITLTAHE